MSRRPGKKADRLKKRSDFLRLQNGRKWVSPSVIVQTAENACPRARFGFTATKKLGGAVIRNRTKRRLRAAARAAAVTLAAPCDIVLIGRTDTATCPYPKLVSDLKWCFKRLELTKATAPCA